VTVNIQTLILGNRANITSDGFAEAFTSAKSNIGESHLEKVVSNVMGLSPIFIATSPANIGVMVKSGIDVPITYIPINHPTRGALGTIGLTLDRLESNCAVLIAPLDAYLDCSLERFAKDMIEMNADCGVISFKSQDARFSYIRTHENTVIEVTEKSVVSDTALSGFTFFGSKDLLVECIEWALMHNVQHQGQFYLAPALNFFIAKRKRFISWGISASDYHRLAD